MHGAVVGGVEKDGSEAQCWQVAAAMLPLFKNAVMHNSHSGEDSLIVY